MDLRTKVKIAIIIKTLVFMMSILVVLSLLLLDVISPLQLFMGLIGYVVGLALIKLFFN